MDIEKKIRKLLALSESPNEFEAQAALLKARQLMAEYKLTEAKLHEGNKKVKTIKTSISCTKQTNFWIFTLSTVIGENYCCQAVHEIRNLVKSLPNLYDCTVLISSHMLSEIELIADDIGILNHGRLLFEGSMNDLRQYALQSGFAADNLEDVFLSMVEKDNMDRKQRAKL